MIKKLVVCFFVLVMSFTCTAFAEQTSSNYEIAPHTDGYTYWKIEKTKLNKTEKGPENYIVQGRAADSFKKTVTVTITESITGNVSGTLKEAICAAVGITSTGSIRKSVEVSGTFGKPGDPPDKIYELRSWAIYDLYSVKGKEYTRIDGYEVATGNSFGYSGDKEKAKTAKKFRAIGYGTFPV